MMMCWRCEMEASHAKYHVCVPFEKCSTLGLTNHENCKNLQRKIKQENCSVLCKLQQGDWKNYCTMPLLLLLMLMPFVWCVYNAKCQK